MSKNKRLFRGFIAGFIFVGFGIIGSMNADRYGVTESSDRNVTRRLASTACGLCGELKRIKQGMAARPASAQPNGGTPKTEFESLDPLTFRSRAKVALAESFDHLALRKAGEFISDLLSARDPGEDELRAITVFLVTTAPRDGAGIVLDMVSEALEVEKTDLFLNAVEAQMAALAFDKVLSVKQTETLKATFAAFRDQSTSGQD